MSKLAKELQFQLNVRRKIFMRDQGKCIFCEAGFPVPDTEIFGKTIKDIMHYIPRSHMGKGIEQNGAIGCRYHHMKLDNGNDPLLRKAMMKTFEEHLRKHYTDWNEKELVYSKWDSMRKEER